MGTEGPSEAGGWWLVCWEAVVGFRQRSQGQVRVAHAAAWCVGVGGLVWQSGRDASTTGARLGRRRRGREWQVLWGHSWAGAAVGPRGSLLQRLGDHSALAVEAGTGTGRGLSLEVPFIKKQTRDRFPHTKFPKEKQEALTVPALWRGGHPLPAPSLKPALTVSQEWSKSSSCELAGPPGSS